MFKEYELYEDFNVPAEMLADANIPLDYGLVVTIQDGSILIERDYDEWIPEDVYQLCRHFGISRTKTRRVLRNVITRE